jgi:hypothetical protein
VDNTLFGCGMIMGSGPEPQSLPAAMDDFNKWLASNQKAHKVDYHLL